MVFRLEGMKNTKAFGVANMSAMTKAPRSPVFSLESSVPSLQSRVNDIGG